MCVCICLQVLADSFNYLLGLTLLCLNETFNSLASIFSSLSLQYPPPVHTTPLCICLCLHLCFNLGLFCVWSDPPSSVPVYYPSSVASHSAVCTVSDSPSWKNVSLFVYCNESISKLQHEVEQFCSWSIQDWIVFEVESWFLRTKKIKKWYI